MLRFFYFIKIKVKPFSKRGNYGYNGIEKNIALCNECYKHRIDKKIIRRLIYLLLSWPYPLLPQQYVRCQFLLHHIIVWANHAQ